MRKLSCFDPVVEPPPLSPPAETPAGQTREYCKVDARVESGMLSTRASGPALVASMRLVDHETEGAGAGRSQERGGGDLGQVAAVDREGAHSAQARIDHVEEAAIRREAGVEGTQTLWTLERRAAQETERAVRSDGEARDAGH